MRSRISVRGLLPAALAAASAVAVAAPASAQDAPPPGPATTTTTTSTPADNGDCARAVKVLSVLKLLPSTPDLGKVLCSENTAGKQGAVGKDNTVGKEQAPATGTAQRPASEKASESAQQSQEYNLLGLPLEWPKSLTVHVPTLNDHWYVYKSTKQ